MKHLIFSQQQKTYSIGFLIKEKAFHYNYLMEHYISPLEQLGLNKDSIIALSLKYNEHNKAPSKLVHAHLQTVLKAANSIGITTLVVADSEYFKKLTKITSKVDQQSGYVLPCKVKDYEHINIILSLNYQALFHNPVNKFKIEKSNKTLIDHIGGILIEPGAGIIHSAKYIRHSDKLNEYEAELDKLLEYPVLTCDIEAFSLEFHKAGIGTIAFAWDEHNGIAFQIDYETNTRTSNKLSVDIREGYQLKLGFYKLKKILAKFFKAYKGKLIFHNAPYDVGIIIYELFMEGDLNNIVGLVTGLQKMYLNTEDTKLITYLAVNSTAGNKLDLKTNAFDFAGNYAQEDIKDIRKIPLNTLLEYNLTDCLATWYVYKKNYPIMIKDDQEDIYLKIFKPSLRVVSHMQLTGMPMHRAIIQEKNIYVRNIQNKAMDILEASPLIEAFSWKEQCKRMVLKNLLLKKKIKPIEDFKEDFNPNSNKQLQELLYEFFGLPIIDLTETKQPATGKDTLNKLLNYLITKFNITEEELK